MNRPHHHHHGQLNLSSRVQPRRTLPASVGETAGPTKRQCFGFEDGPSVALSDASSVDFGLSALLLRGGGTGNRSYYEASAPAHPSADKAKRSSATAALDSRIDSLLGRIQASSAGRNPPPLTPQQPRPYSIDAAISAFLDSSSSRAGSSESDETLISSPPRPKLAASRAAAAAAWERDSLAMFVSSSRLTEPTDERRRIQQLEDLPNLLDEGPQNYPSAQPSFSSSRRVGTSTDFSSADQPNDARDVASVRHGAGSSHVGRGANAAADGDETTPASSFRPAQQVHHFSRRQVGQGPSTTSTASSKQKERSVSSDRVPLTHPLRRTVFTGNTA